MKLLNPKKIFAVCLILTSCGGFSKGGTKASNRLLDEFRVDEYRNYVIISKSKSTSKFTNVSMYCQEKKRYVQVKTPNWLASYWEEGDTIR